MPDALTLMQTAHTDDEWTRDDQWRFDLRTLLALIAWAVEDDRQTQRGKRKAA